MTRPRLVPDPVTPGPCGAWHYQGWLGRGNQRRPWRCQVCDQIWAPDDRERADRLDAALLTISRRQQVQP